MSRKSGLIGVVFAVLFAAFGFLDNGPSQDLSNASTAAWYTHHSLAQWMISTTFGALAGVCAIVFAAVLRQRITSTADRSLAAQLVAAGGYVAAALLLAGVALYGTIPIQHLFNDAALPTPAASRALLGASYATGFVVAPLAFGLMIVAVSLLGLRHGTLPRWLAIAGFPLAAVQLASLLFFPAWLIVLWSLATGVALTTRTTRPAVPEPHPAAVLT
jgi:Domain of unknown function (DUF4386)